MNYNSIQFNSHIKLTINIIYFLIYEYSYKLFNSFTDYIINNLSYIIFIVNLIIKLLII